MASLSWPCGWKLTKKRDQRMCKKSPSIKPRGGVDGIFKMVLLQQLSSIQSQYMKSKRWGNIDLHLCNCHLWSRVPSLQSSGGIIDCDIVITQSPSKWSCIQSFAHWPKLSQFHPDMKNHRQLNIVILVLGGRGRRAILLWSKWGLSIRLRPAH